MEVPSSFHTVGNVGSYDERFPLPQEDAALTGGPSRRGRVIFAPKIRICFLPGKQSVEMADDVLQMKFAVGDDLIPGIDHIIFRRRGECFEILELKSRRIDIRQPSSVKRRMSLRVREHPPQASPLFLTNALAAPGEPRNSLGREGADVLNVPCAKDPKVIHGSTRSSLRSAVSSNCNNS